MNWFDMIRCPTVFLKDQSQYLQAMKSWVDKEALMEYEKVLIGIYREY